MMNPIGYEIDGGLYCLNCANKKIQEKIEKGDDFARGQPDPILPNEFFVEGFDCKTCSRNLLELGGKR